MKNKFLYTVVLSIALFGCKDFTKEKETTADVNKCTQYACPIHRDKTSTTLEACPACNTTMLPLDSLKKDSVRRSK